MHTIVIESNPPEPGRQSHHTSSSNQYHHQIFHSTTPCLQCLKIPRITSQRLDTYKKRHKPSPILMCRNRQSRTRELAMVAICRMGDAYVLNSISHSLLQHIRIPSSTVSQGSSAQLPSTFEQHLRSESHITKSHPLALVSRFGFYLQIFLAVSTRKCQSLFAQLPLLFHACYRVSSSIIPITLGTMHAPYCVFPFCIRLSMYCKPNP